MMCGSSTFSSRSLRTTSQAVQPGHLDIHEHHVRLQLLNQFDRLQAVPRHAHHLNIGEALDQEGKLLLR